MLFFESEAYVIFNDISSLILVILEMVQEAIRYLIIGDESFCTFQQKTVLIWRHKGLEI